MKYYIYEIKEEGYQGYVCIALSENFVEVWYDRLSLSMYREVPWFVFILYRIFKICDLPYYLIPGFVEPSPSPEIPEDEWYEHIAAKNKKGAFYV